jgi:cell shape-determining protein MreC
MKRSSFLRASGFGRGVRLFDPVVFRRGVIALGILVLIFGVRFIFPNAFSFVLAPVWNIGSALSAGVGSSATIFTSEAQQRAERDELVARAETLSAENAVLAARLSDLTRLLGTRTEPMAGIVAGVVARPPVSPYDVLILDTGTNAGVKVGARVEGAGGVPLGIIAATTNTSARALLYSSPGKVTSAWLGEERLPLEVTGVGSGGFRASVAREVAVKEGDLLYFAGPGAVPSGIVVDASTDPSDTKVRLQIRPYVNPFSVTWVTITNAAGL